MHPHPPGPTPYALPPGTSHTSTLPQSARHVVAPPPTPHAITSANTLPPRFNTFPRRMMQCRSSPEGPPSHCLYPTISVSPWRQVVVVKTLRIYTALTFSQPPDRGVAPVLQAPPGGCSKMSECTFPRDTTDIVHAGRMWECGNTRQQ